MSMSDILAPKHESKGVSTLTLKACNTCGEVRPASYGQKKEKPYDELHRLSTDKERTSFHVF